MKVSYYRVYFMRDDERDEIYVQASSSQKAADVARDIVFGCEIIEIAKVVNNWK